MSKSCDTSLVTSPSWGQSKIRGYRMGKSLGHGTFGKVKLGYHQITNEPVAIKILEKAKIKDPADVERVSRELRILKTVRHKNIVQLYDVIETPKYIYMVMEYAKGGELFDYIVKNKKIKEDKASKFMLQILSAIEYLHKLRIVHRDLKPENLLIDENGNMKIIDFGLSNTYSTNQLLKTACGSPCYAAPEMVSGKMYEGLKVDLWSAGVVLFAMVSGHLPFEDPNTKALYKKICTANYKLPRHLSPSCRDLIQKLLQVDPAKRITIEGIRYHAWMVMKKPTIRTSWDSLSFSSTTDLDQTVLTALDSLGLSSDYARSCLDSCKVNHVTATYHLLLRRQKTDSGAVKKVIMDRKGQRDTSPSISTSMVAVSTSTQPRETRDLIRDAMKRDTSPEAIPPRPPSSSASRQTRIAASFRQRKYITPDPSPSNENINKTTILTTQPKFYSPHNYRVSTSHRERSTNATFISSFRSSRKPMVPKAQSLGRRPVRVRKTDYSEIMSSVRDTLYK